MAVSAIVSGSKIARSAHIPGRLGSHPHIVTVFDLGQEVDQPYMVTELMGGGDVEGVHGISSVLLIG